MPPRRSARIASRPDSSTKGTSDASIARLKRGARGYRKRNNGLLNVTAIGPEIAITKKNSLQAPLLFLPAEIRNRIWELALGGSTIVIYSKIYAFFDNGCRELPDPPPTDRFTLLRVCRQIYSETAVIPYALNTFSFIQMAEVGACARSESGSMIGYVRRIRVGKRLLCIQNAANPRHKRLPLERLHSLETVDVDLHDDFSDGQYVKLYGPEVETLVRGQLEGKKVNVRFLYGQKAVRASWRAK